MDNGYQIRRAPSELTGLEIESLREAVGWPRNAGQYGDIIANSYTNFCIRAEGRLIAFVNVISDGIGNACLVDLMVHPDLQHRGIGRALVRCAVHDLAADGIQQIQTTFPPALERFYQKCGFHILKAGVVDNTSTA